MRARVTGILERQLYNEGDAVKARARRCSASSARRSRSSWRRRAALLAQELAREELAQQESERLKGLADRRAISQKEADQAASAARQTAAAVQVAQARVRQAELNLSYTKVARADRRHHRPRAAVGRQPGLAQQRFGAAHHADAGRSDLGALLAVRGGVRARPRQRRQGDEVQDRARRRQAVPAHGQAQLRRLHRRCRAPARCRCAPSCRTRSSQLLPGPVRARARRRRHAAGDRRAADRGDAERERALRLGARADGKAVQRPIRAGSWLGNDWVVLDGPQARRRGDRRQPGAAAARRRPSRCKTAG